MTVSVTGTSESKERPWKNILLDHVSHRWRQKLLITFLLIPCSLGLYYYTLELMVQTKIFSNFVEKGHLAYATAIYVIGLAVVLWFGPVRPRVSDSFLEIDLRKKGEAKKFRPVYLCANNAAVAILVGDGQVKYYPKNLVPKDVKLEDYITSQQSEIDRLAVSHEDMQFLAKAIDMHGLIRNKKSAAPDNSQQDDVGAAETDVVDSSICKSQFVTIVESVIESLDEQIETAERKASNLLDVGRKYLKNGIYCYGLSIVLWQFVLYRLDYNWNWGIGAGVISCAVAFVVVEFLAAWFLKQYRHYGDSVQTYMMVRSVYERHLLAYYALDEFSEVHKDNEICRSSLLKVLSEEIKWPDLKQVNANDFNYMVKSFDSLSGVLEKFRGGKSGVELK